MRLSLAEDLGAGDLTSEASIPSRLLARATVRAKCSGVFAGGPIAAAVLRTIDSKIRIIHQKPEGYAFRRGETLFVAQGKARALLAAERTALNFLQHLCAIATQTAQVVRAVAGTKVRVLATRKTIPGMRALQKYAVQVGGGAPHRQGLFDAVLLKENHLELAGLEPELLLPAMRFRLGPKAPVGAEARSLQEALGLLEGGADWILLDNMKPTQLRRTVRSLRAAARKEGKALELEASGGINVRNAKSYARTGVDRISLGALTHSVAALDLSMDFIPMSSPRSRRDR